MTQIRRVRIGKNLSQAALARIANLYPSNLSRLETGNGRAGPTVSRRIANALDVGVDELFDSAGWPLQAEVLDV